ncbi:site-2 protease family protein [uncultured Methanosphaera sp.]|uniref:site-2 protease family protein n=1 Tax=uncultured Methanosphaera sp. TaxID=262501 RepID=UPI000DC5A2F8|nr:site-2 protease family protein [uncultured Methanosphaera sp.]RAP43863.1 MAG: membrane-associated Zn-dependent protease [Methanosphaera sp. SHI1033]
MNALWYYVIGFIVVWVLAYLLKDKYNITMDGIVLMLKTDKLKNVIDRIANACPRFWKWYMNISIPVGIFLIILMVVSLVWSIQLMFETPTVSLILPGVDIPGSPIYIPFASGLIALATVLIIHEGGHGILSRVEGISVDSVGLLLFAIIPGAFVEPNQDEIDKANGISKLRIYFAGPMFNVGLAIIALLVVAGIGGFLATENVYTTDGMEISSVVPASPAEGILSDGMVITQVNNQTTLNTTSYTKAVNNTHIGDNLTIATNSGTYNVVTGSNPNNSTRPYIGIRTQEHKIVSPEAREKYGTILPAILSQLEELFSMIFFLNLAVGTFNLLPMKPLDGGLILEELINIKIRPDRRKQFNDTLNHYTRKLPMNMRCWISRRFNTVLNFISHHEISEKKSGVMIRTISSIIMVIIVMLLIYGLVPGLLDLL